MIQIGKENNNLGCRLYKNPGDRRRGVAHLKRLGYNYFTGFKDTHPTHPAGLSYGKVEWASLISYERDI
jgi:hypothetical protein